MIKFLETQVEAKAHRMLKHKRFYAWLWLITLATTGLRLLYNIQKFWVEYDIGHAIAELWNFWFGKEEDNDSAPKEGERENTTCDHSSVCN